MKGPNIFAHVSVQHKEILKKLDIKARMPLIASKQIVEDLCCVINSCVGGNAEILKNAHAIHMHSSFALPLF